MGEGIWLGQGARKGVEREAALLSFQFTCSVNCNLNGIYERKVNLKNKHGNAQNMVCIEEILSLEVTKIKRTPCSCGLNYEIQPMVS